RQALSIPKPRRRPAPRCGRFPACPRSSSHSAAPRLWGRMSSWCWKTGSSTQSAAMLSCSPPTRSTRQSTIHSTKGGPKMALSGKKPKNFGFTFKTLLSYMGRHKFLFLIVAVLVSISAAANLLGTYMIRPVVASAGRGVLPGFWRCIAATAALDAGGAVSALGYTQTMVRAAQKVLSDIRHDLCGPIQALPLRFFDTQRRGDIMSYFTSDVD